SVPATLLFYAILPSSPSHLFFSFTPPAPPDIYTLSLHDALPISLTGPTPATGRAASPTASTLKRISSRPSPSTAPFSPTFQSVRSEEHTSELQSLRHLVCRLLLEKKKHKKYGRCVFLTKTNPLSLRSTLCTRKATILSSLCLLSFLFWHLALNVMLAAVLVVHRAL